MIDLAVNAAYHVTMQQIAFIAIMGSLAGYAWLLFRKIR